ncbi:class F sortase, partial [Corynebacterium sp.]|uniref:class F sortase n=1 Tax=Corynebacterium sp. TaxID=1720 RepID=UPI0039C87B10
LLVLGLASMCSGGEATSPAPVAPSNSAHAAPSATERPAPSASAASAIAPPSTEAVPVSRPVQLAVPSLGMDAPVEQEDCRVVGDVIDPASLREACAYTAPDRPYSLPGSDAPDVVVIAGHTGAGVPAVFNSLFDGRSNRHTVSIGDVLYVRTRESGSNWLAYRATDLHEPRKEGLAESAEIWGTGPTPGRLLTISCIQPANPLANSVQNAVVGWQFDRVVSGEQVDANMGWSR